MRRSLMLDPKLAAIGVCGGLLSGLLGVGGGVVMVPLLVLWASYGQRDAHAISLGAIIPISIAGIATYGIAGEVRWWDALALAAGSIVGAQTVNVRRIDRPYAAPPEPPSRRSALQVVHADD